MRILSFDHSLLHAQVRANALRRLLKTHLEGDLSKLPTRAEIDGKASKEADDAVRFEIRKEIFEEAREDFPEPVVREIHDILGPDLNDPFMPEVTWEAGLLEKEVHDEIEHLVAKSVETLAKKVGENNISSLRVEMQKAIRNMAASGATFSESIDITSPSELDRLMHFNKPMTKKIFEPAMAKVLEAQWRDFNFTVRVYLFGAGRNIHGVLSKATLTVSFRVKDNYMRRTRQPKKSSDVKEALICPYFKKPLKRPYVPPKKQLKRSYVKKRALPKSKSKPRKKRKTKARAYMFRG